MRSLTFIFVLLILCFPFVASAAFIEPVLEDQLLAAKPTDRFSVILKLYNPRDIFALDQELHARRARLAERHVLVIEALKANAADTQGPVAAAIEAWKSAGEVEGYTTYWIENLIVVYGSSRAILALAVDRAVESIGPNFQAELIEPIGRGPIRSSRPGHLDNEQLTPGQNAIRATQVNRELGINGQGVLVANLDTGVDGAHDAFDTRWRGTHAPVAECWLDLIGAGGNFPVDNNSHGTHVMGTICGREINGNDTNTVGSAPLAEWIACNAVGAFGGDFSQDILDAFEWFADPDGDPQTMEDVPDVIQNSWGVNTGLGYPQCYSNWNTSIANCEAIGVVVTWSAGNEASSGLRSPAIYSLSATQIFSVGAVDATNDPTPPYQIASFSSLGPTPCTPAIPNNIKPEICAPGVDVYSSVPGGGYQGGWSGTSMAGPHVAGCVALMREACPDCDSQTIKEAIMATAVDSGYGPAGEDNTFGAGFIDCYQAVLAVFNLGRVDGYVTSSGSPLPGVRVQSLSASNFAMTDALGYYTLTAQADTHTIRFTKFGYETVDVDSVVTIEGDTAHVDATMNTVPMGVLAATVVTQVGIPIQNALLYVRNAPYDTVTSDVNGLVVVDSLPATTWEVWLRMTVNTTPPRAYTTTVDVDVQAGDTTFADLEIFIDLVEPIGPDAYGYSVYDRYDRDLPAPAEWVELDPDLGYPGINFTFTHHDSSTFFRTPFTLGFYGTDRDTLTVNPNGWMLPGDIHMSGATNYTIPFNASNPPLDPPGIIAPTWDDFRMGLGARQFHYYDQDNGRWIFEFVDQRLVTPGNRFLNWQVQLYDPAVHPTLTGDAEIVIVYHLMEHLDGCTIGIENPAETTGLRVRFNTTQDTTAWPIENGAALRYTTGHPDATGTIMGMLTLYPSTNEITNAVLHIGGDVASPAANGQFSADSVGAARVCIALNLDGYESRRLNRVTVGEDSTTNVTMGAWRLDPPRNLSGSQVNDIVTITWQRPLSVEAQPNPELRYNFYRNGLLAESGLTDTTTVDVVLSGEVVDYTVLAIYRYGLAWSDTLEWGLGVDDEINGALPTVYELYQNYPNPFNPNTNIRLDVPEQADGKLMIYDITGRLVRTLYDGALNAGRYTFSWDSRDDHGGAVSTGMYLYRFSSRNYVATQKMLLMK